MRISMSRAWMAVTYMVLGLANGQDRGQDAASPINTGVGKANESVLFDPLKFKGNYNPEAAIFLVKGSMPGTTFTWRSQNYEVVNKIALWQSSEDNSAMSGMSPPQEITFVAVVYENPPEQPSGQFPEVTTSTNTLNLMMKPTVPSPTPGAPGVRLRQPPKSDGCSKLISARQNGPGGSLMFDPNELRAKCDKVFKPGFPLYFVASWVDNGQYRKSYSRAFTVVYHEEGYAVASTNPLFKDTNPYIQMGSDDGTDAPEAPSATSTPLGGGSIPTNGDPAALSPAPKSGLELGAIIGIAVGCGLAGLLAVLGIIWFVVRRRQQKQNLHPTGSFNSDHRGDDLMAEKEAHTGVDVDASPNSPYSDDGHPNGTYPTGTAVTTIAAPAAAAPPHLQDQSRSYTPYSDRAGAAAGITTTTPSTRTESLAQNDDGARANVPSPIPGRATPRGLTTPYAHLVEEGMTEDEIRRLEEEERQLDAAIEQAGRR
ncbi:uncharacterized protein QC761_113640 [Podospora bellae-mahoneyi]|uniref:Mid2 domain-containing protein n=1 Tax=Podospora bellae-mahoneyi TaxID=2093777 RepID=A0ABR0FZB7_9PEZI|nr:hypothetical protein QC761_113640 [Podospora bellae-mahoneyi]